MQRNPNYGTLFEKWEIAIAKKLVWKYCSSSKRLQRDGQYDLLQEILIHWLDVKANYDPKRKATIKTYMWHIVENRLNNILDRVKAEGRKTIYESESLDIPRKDEDGNVYTHRKRIEKANQYNTQIGLENDLTKGIKNLTPQQQQIIRLLEKQFAKTEIAKTLKLHRATIDREIKRIRQQFEEKGLREYIK